MKSSHLPGVLFMLIATASQGQVAEPDATVTASSTPVLTQAVSPFYIVSERGPHHRVIQKVVPTTNDRGQISLTTNSAYIELATGMHHLVAGKWVESTEDIQIVPTGGGAATNGAHQAYFPGDIYQGAISVMTPDGKNLRFRPLGLGYFDGTNSVLIAELTNSVGQILPSGNRVVYTNAFSGDIVADVRYTYTRAGFESDVILRTCPPGPEQYGLNPAAVRLQVLTEFFSPPQPILSTSTLPDQAGLSLVDDTLSFGTMDIGLGQAFMAGTSAQAADVYVAKEWVQLSGRQFLIEEVPVRAVAQQLQTLPQPALNATLEKRPRIVSRELALPAPRLVKDSQDQPMRMAKVDEASPALVLDFQTINTSQNGYTFQGNETYYISGLVYFVGNITFEGGAVIKYATNASISASSGQYALNITCLATDYRPVIFTAKDDDSVGQSITNSTGDPSTTFYANPALAISAANGATTIAHFRIACAKQAIKLSSGSYKLYHGQIVNCQNGITTSVGYYGLYNLAFSGVLTNFNSVVSSGPTVQNATFNASACLAASVSLSSSLSFTNCIFVNVTNLFVQNSGSIYAGYNGFYGGGGQTFGTSITSSPDFPLQAAGAGNHYLSDGCPFRDIGTTNIDAALLADLRKKTTFPPIVCSNVSITVPATWGQTLQRDTDVPDLGYHYDPLDYLCSQISVGPGLTIGNNVAVGLFGSAGFAVSGGGYGFTSTGSADLLNHLVWYPSVQEQPVCLNNVSTANSALFDIGSYSYSPKLISLRFTDIAMQGKSQNFFVYGLAYYWPFLTLRDCQLRGVSLSIFWYYADSPYSSVSLWNNLLERCSVYLFNGYASYPPDTFQNPLAVLLCNNLFWKGDLGLTFKASQMTEPPTWLISDNLLDTVPFTFVGDGNYASLMTVNSNAYHNTSSPLQALPRNIGSPNYAKGPLGTWYIRSTSPTLVDAGSRGVDQAALYHYTMFTNLVNGGLYESPDIGVVDIGFHYVATDINGAPLDYDGDGIPDYLEDSNGNGTFGAGDLSSWTNYTSANGLAGANGLRVFTPLK